MRFGFWSVFTVVFIAEIPCILRTVAIQLKTDSVWDVVWGTMAGSLVALIVGILFAKVCLTNLPLIADRMQLVSGGCLILLGLLLLFKP